MVCSDPDNNSNGDTKDDIGNPKGGELAGPDQNEFEIQEETALLIESIMHPEFDMDPEQLLIEGRTQNGSQQIGWDK